METIYGNSELSNSKRPQTTMLMLLILLFMTPVLIDFSLGQTVDQCGEYGYLCPEGQCCNMQNTCGNTTEYCGQGNCSSQCPKFPFQCGPQFSNAVCPADGSCCSIYSWCGLGNAWCGSGNCSSQCPNDTCGSNGGQCPDGYCCDYRGYCGNTAAYCGVGKCSSQCPSIPPTPAPTPGGLLETGGLTQRRSKSNLGIIVGIPGGVVAFLIACVVIGLFVRRHSGGHSSWEDDPTIQVEGMPERFSYKHLSVATRAFSQESKLGQGGFGSVYRGVLPSSGIPVAVKKINADSSQGEKEFMAEISIISRLRHRNLIQLHGWCKDVARERYLLVYELMPNGSLDKVLFQPDECQTPCLSWAERFKIVTGLAAAVDYLHQGWNQQVIHRDIKSSNIMLDEEWNAKLGDFGLARLVDHQRAGATTVVAGTYGYIAPEAATTGRFTEKTDVYAFGAVLLEMACGRRAFSAELPPEEMLLVDWVWERLSEGALLSTVDKRLATYDTYWMEVVMIVGLLCSHPDPVARPSMRQVVQVLAGDVPVPDVPSSKPAAVYNSKKVSIGHVHGRKSSSSTSLSWSGFKPKSGSISLVTTSSSHLTQASTSMSLSTPDSDSSLPQQSRLSGDELTSSPRQRRS